MCVFLCNKIVIRLHKEYLEKINQGKKKSIQWLLGEHNRHFADWFQQKVGLYPFPAVLLFCATHAFS